MGRIGKAVLVAYPLMMAFTLVLSGEHYLVDVFIGWGYAAAVIALWLRELAAGAGLAALCGASG